MTLRETGAGGPQTASELATRRLGSEVRRARVSRGLTLVDIAEATGLSVSMLSMLERGKTGISVGSLVAVASALGIGIGDLFGPAGTSDSTVVRYQEQTELAVGPGVTRRLVQRSGDTGLEVATLTLEPGAHTGAELVRHEGQEVVIAQTGVITVQINSDTVELAEGDSIRLDAQSPHRFSNEGTEMCRALLIVRLPKVNQYGH